MGSGQKDIEGVQEKNAVAADQDSSCRYGVMLALRSSLKVEFLGFPIVFHIKEGNQ